MQLDSISAKRENLANHEREGFDANGRIGAERMSGYYAALRDEQMGIEARLEDLEREMEDLRRDCEND